MTMMISKQQLGRFEVLDFVDEEQTSNRKVLLLDYTQREGDEEEEDGDEYIDFEVAWDRQKEILEKHTRRLQLSSVASEKQRQQQETCSSSSSSFLQENEYDNNEGRDTIIMLQHNPVYTLGTGSDDKFVLAARRNNGDNDNEGDSTTTTTTVPVVRMDRGGEGSLK
jgi:lipoate-protein ligase B